MSPRVAAARGLLGLYPLAWRRRYAEEMTTLIDDDPPSLGGLGTLVSGALRAHVRPGPLGARLSPVDRMRLSVWAVFCCWIGLSVAGAAFQKETEEPSFALAVSNHGALGVARAFVIAGAALGAAAIAVGGLPLLWRAIRQVRTGGVVLRAALLLPFAGLVLFAAVTRLLLAVAPASIEGTSTGLRLALVAPWWAAGAAFALCCVLAPRIALLRLDLPSGELRRASYAGLVLLVAMTLVSAGLVVYCLALLRLEPALSAQSGGPLWPSTGLVLALGAALAAACTVLASVGATRAVVAARA